MATVLPDAEVLIEIVAVARNGGLVRYGELPDVVGVPVDGNRTRVRTGSTVGCKRTRHKAPIVVNDVVLA